MKWFYITFRSVTVAQRGEGALRRMGISCWLQRTPRWIEERGCGYCLRIHPRDVSRSMDILVEKGIPFSRLLQTGEDGAVREVRDDLSG